MADIQAGETFIDGEDVTAARLMAHIENAVILPALITGKPGGPPTSADKFLFYQTSISRLAQCTGTQIAALVPSNSAAATPSLRKLGTGSTDAAAGNDSRFPAEITGIRKANDDDPDTVAGVQDFVEASTQITGTQINWALNNVFHKNLSANTTFTFANAISGQVIIVALQPLGHTATFPALTGDAPVPTSGSTLDIYTFAKIGAWLVGSVKSV